MLRRLAVLSATLCALGFLSLGACGGDDDDDDSSSSSGYCCINGAYYGCPSAEAVNDCPNSCTRDSSRDTTCE